MDGQMDTSNIHSVARVKSYQLSFSLPPAELKSQPDQTQLDADSGGLYPFCTFKTFSHSTYSFASRGAKIVGNSP